MHGAGVALGNHVGGPHAAVLRGLCSRWTALRVGADYQERTCPEARLLTDLHSLGVPPEATRAFLSDLRAPTRSKYGISSATSKSLFYCSAGEHFPLPHVTVTGPTWQVFVLSKGKPLGHASWC